MHKLTIDQIADREAKKEGAAYINPKTGRVPVSEMVRAYERALSRLAQDVDRRTRHAWAGAGSNEPPIGADHPLMKQLREWLNSGKRVERTPSQSGNIVRPAALMFASERVLNEDWKKLFIADDGEVAAWPFMKKDHPNYAPELEAAVSAWIALYGRGENKKRGAGELVPDWLTKHRPEAGKSTKAKDRITAVVTPEHRKTGGAMPSGKK